MCQFLPVYEGPQLLWWRGEMRGWTARASQKVNWYVKHKGDSISDPIQILNRVLNEWNIEQKSVTNMIKGKYQQLEAKKIQDKSLSMAILLSPWHIHNH